MKTKFLFPLCCLVLTSSLVPRAHAQGTAFTYAGRLNDGASLASGQYDFRFKLYLDSAGNTQAGVSYLTNGLAVSNGLFTTTIDFGAGLFTGPNYWLEVAVKTNGAGSYTVLAPLQALTPAPYALFATSASNLLGAVPAAQLSGAVASANLSGTYANAVTLNNAANQFNGNGAALANVNAATLDGLSSFDFWRSTGNSGTSPGMQFVGTTDNRPLELKVNNQRGLRLEPTGSNDTVNVIGGSAHNLVGAGVVGATIGGGGSGNYFGSVSTNRVEADFGTVSGGRGNTIQLDAWLATIGGGNENSIDTSAFEATIAGGFQNKIWTSAALATIGGGNRNTAGANYATISGGRYNLIRPGSDEAAISGGSGNTILADSWSATIGGGSFNTIGEDLAGGNGKYATIGGGYGNLIQADAWYATIPGGYANSAAGAAFAAGTRAKANHTGAFVWADSTSADFASTGSNQFCIRASGGVRLSDSTPNISFGTVGRQMLNLWGTQYGIGVQSATVYFRTDSTTLYNGFAWYKGGTHNDGTQNPGGGTTLMKLDGTGLTVNGTFVSASDRNVKQDFANVNSRAVLEKVARLPIQTWAYKDDLHTKHLGPVAQDFYAAFAIGPDDKHITTVDESGVALAAIQGLNEKLAEELKRRDTENAELKARLERLERRLDGRNGDGQFSQKSSGSVTGSGLLNRPNPVRQN